MNWISFLTEQASKLPLERLFVRPSDNKKTLNDLQEILSESHAKPAETPAEEIPEEAEEGHLEPHQPKVHLPSQEGGLSTEETAVYQNREIGKLLLRMERHYAQRLRVNGIPCDCGSQKHLLDLESLCEETIPMVDNPQVYYHIIEWIKKVGPTSTDEAAKSGLYDEEYPGFSHEARDFRKEITGSLDYKTLFPQKPGEPEGTSILPVVSEEEREKIKQKAIQKVEEVLK